MLLHGRRRNWRRLTYVRKLNLIAIQRQVVLQDDIERGAARELRIWTAGEEHGAKSCEAANSSTYPGTFGSARDCADSRAGYRGLGDGADVFAFATRTGHFAF